MTDQPPPPPGNYPPPPPPPGGYPPPPGPQSGGSPPDTSAGWRIRSAGWRIPAAYAARWARLPSAACRTGRALPKEAYTPWLTRVFAYSSTTSRSLIVEGIGWLLLIGTRETACVTDTSEYDLGEFCATGASTIGQLSIALTGLIALAYVIWNLGYRQGTTGSQHRQGHHEVQNRQRKDRAANRFRHVDRPRTHLSRRMPLRHHLATSPLPVPAVGPEAADARRQDHRRRSACLSRRSRAAASSNQHSKLNLPMEV